MNRIYEDDGKVKTIYASYIYCTELYICKWNEDESIYTPYMSAENLQKNVSANANIPVLFKLLV